MAEQYAELSNSLVFGTNPFHSTDAARVTASGGSWTGVMNITPLSNISPDAVNPQVIFNRGLNSDGNRELTVNMDGVGRCRPVFSLDGTDNLVNAPTPNPPLSSNVSMLLKWEQTTDDGGGNHVLNAYRWVNGAWALNATQTVADAGSPIFDSGEITTVGNQGPFFNTPFVGQIKRIQVYEGIGVGGTNRWDFNPNDWTSGSSWVSSTTGETWNINAGGAIRTVPPAVLVHPNYRAFPKNLLRQAA